MKRRGLSLVPGICPDAGGEALRSLAVALAPHLRELLAAEVHAGELVDVCRAVPGPKRSVMRACRDGRITGAVRVGRRWLAPRASVENWLRTMEPRSVASRDDDGELDALRERLARSTRRRVG